MAVTQKRFEVGDKLYHEDYGEGMVVAVRPRTFFDVLEVAFGEEVRRLNSNHPKISDSPPKPAPRPAPSGARTEAPGKPAPEPAAARGRGNGRGAPSVAARKQSATGKPRPAAESAEEQEETDGALRFSDDSTLHLDLASVEGLLKVRKPPAGSDRDLLFHLQAEKLSLTRGFRNLLALSGTHDLERYDFQIQACLRVLRNMRGRAILADEVGLGKTIEAGLVLREYILRGLVRKALVLTPVSLMSQWREELRHKLDLPFEIRARGQSWSGHPWLIASIDTAKTERNREEIGEAGFDLLIVDEAHRLRNHLTQGWKFVDALSLKYLLLLTATPVQNDLRELYNLVTLLKPGLLGTYRSFRKNFMVRGDKRLPKDASRLAATLSGVMVRTSRSSTSLTFPRREVRIEEFEMSPEERKFYDGISDFVREVMLRSEDKDLSRWVFLLLLLQKELGSSTYAALKTLERSEPVFARSPVKRQWSRLLEIGRSVRVHSKTDGLKRLLRSEKDEKILVFTQFRRTLEFLEQELRAEGLHPAVFHGSLPPKAKDQAIEEFRHRRRILLSTEAGGEGRNLQFCRVVVNFDLPWNPMRIEQRIGRVHRLGQTRDTMIWNFTTRDTVEDYVLSILHRKIQMFELVIGEMDMVLGQWSDRDSFEHEVFRIWTEFRDPRDRKKAFDKLGEDLLLARQRHERVEEYDNLIFSRLDRPLAGTPE